MEDKKYCAGAIRAGKIIFDVVSTESGMPSPVNMYAKIVQEDSGLEELLKALRPIIILCRHNRIQTSMDDGSVWVDALDPAMIKEIQEAILKCEE